MPGPSASKKPRASSDWPFLACLAVIGGTYLVLIVAMVLADLAFTSPSEIWGALSRREIQYAIKLSLFSCTAAALLSILVGIPLGYLLSRECFPGKGMIDAIIDIPIVLPPLVIGLSLLILFQVKLGGKSIEEWFQAAGMPVTFQVPSVILAQFAVAAAFAVRTMRVTFDQINPRAEQVALTLGCSRAQAFWRVTLPEARRGVFTAATLAWARSLGEFGPILVFSGATRMRTEVLSTTVFLELSVGSLRAAVAVSLLMIATAVVVLVIVRGFGLQPVFRKGTEP
ncbi:MAG TPA: ABC transporter permease [Candidatus Acidoferrum sp.]|nr:ABC transporter permease [Candidatus Acidoferrum sp.]